MLFFPRTIWSDPPRAVMWWLLCQLDPRAVWCPSQWLLACHHPFPYHLWCSYFSSFSGDEVGCSRDFPPHLYENAGSANNSTWQGGLAYSTQYLPLPPFNSACLYVYKCVCDYSFNRLVKFAQTHFSRASWSGSSAPTKWTSCAQSNHSPAQPVLLKCWLCLWMETGSTTASKRMDSQFIFYVSWSFMLACPCISSHLLHHWAHVNSSAMQTWNDCNHPYNLYFHVWSLALRKGVILMVCSSARMQGCSICGRPPKEGQACKSIFYLFLMKYILIILCIP